MRRALVLTTLAIFVASIIGIPQAARSQGSSAGVLRVAIESLGNEILDPILGPASATKLYLPLMYDSLIGTDKTNSAISKDTGVARDWKVSNGGKTYTFLLRRGVKFSNGDDLTADDVKFSLERTMGPRSVSSFAGTLKKTIESITVVDPYTLRIDLKAPSFAILQNLSSLIGSESMIVPKKYVEKVGDETFAKQPIGSGPYHLKRYVPGQEIDFEANPNHWYVGVPKFKEVDLLNVPEQGTRLTMLRGSEADVISIARQYAVDLERAGFLIETKRASHEMQFLINNQWDTKSPLHDKRVRKAMELAVDRKAILDKLMLGAGEMTRCWLIDIAYSLRPKGLCDPVPYDPAGAKKLLADAGYANGFDVTFDSYATPGIPEKSEVDQALATYLRAVGIRATIRQLEYGAYRAQWPKPESLPNTIANNPTLSQVVIGSLIQVFWGKDGLLSTTRGVNPVADKAIDEMLDAKTLEDYGRYEFAAWRALLDDSNVVMLFSVDSKYAANAKKIGKGWAMGTSTADIGLRWLVKR